MADYGVFDRIFAFQINPLPQNSIAHFLVCYYFSSGMFCPFTRIVYCQSCPSHARKHFPLQNFRRFRQIQTDGEPVIYAVPKSFNAGEPVNGYRFCNSVLSHDAPVKQVFPAIKEQNCTCYMVNFSIIKFAEAIFYLPPPVEPGTR